MPGPRGACIEGEPDAVRVPGDGHERSGDRLVAPAEREEGVGHVPCLLEWWGGGVVRDCWLGSWSTICTYVRQARDGQLIHYMYICVRTLVHRLDGVGDEVSRDEGVPHRLRPVRHAAHLCVRMVRGRHGISLYKSHRHIDIDYQYLPVRNDGRAGHEGLSPLGLHLLHQQVRQLPDLWFHGLSWVVGKS